jgi:hypothetical protein
MNSGIYVEDKNLRRISMSVIRDIENIIDHYHENHAVLKNSAIRHFWIHYVFLKMHVDSALYLWL